MDQFSSSLNEILVEMYHNILKMEEQALKNKGNLHLSINEMHLIECVGKGAEKGLTISEIALALDITRPSATVAVNKLEKKGYLKKQSCENDGRVVRVFLTRRGKVIDSYHRFYHTNMIKEISGDFNEEEKTCLLRAVGKLNDYFKNSIGDNR